MTQHHPAAVAALRRWEDAGAIWRVIGRRGGTLVIGLYECTGGDEVDRIVSDDPDLLRFVAEREG
ncbi:hypothetical protein [Nocardia pseudobrasiliensis]|uniref:Uncharacterized protein n=1 Tax=Nocardia pseudobrasiliensis TaxID=45979 RepID=A0A370HQ18_9NOCA|nr:hypothetical protein [Nocardia pseudobrasiliensis]RDI60420.1 hypothetical protein DFR76_11548 [Nocardia pseudobrasiliensis]